MGLRKVVLATVTLVLLASQAAVVVPVLAPFHLWATRRSGPAGRALWPLAAGLGAAAAAWALVYQAAGERQPLIWLVPGVAGVAAFLLVRHG